MNKKTVATASTIDNAPPCNKRGNANTNHRTLGMRIKVQVQQFAKDQPQRGNTGHSPSPPIISMPPNKKVFPVGGELGHVLYNRSRFCRAGFFDPALPDALFLSTTVSPSVSRAPTIADPADLAGAFLLGCAASGLLQEPLPMCVGGTISPAGESCGTA